METFKFEGLIVRLLFNAGLLPSNSAGAQAPRTSSTTATLRLVLVAVRHFLSSMAKNKRKRKLKEQDFQKVKLKVGKKLQPAQNATDTSFKSRSVFIPNQLQKLDSEPTNQRNQTLKVRLSNWYYPLLTFNQTKSKLGSKGTLCNQPFLSFDCSTLLIVCMCTAYIRDLYLGVKTCEVFLCLVAINYVDFFIFFLLRHWRVSQVFTPRMSLASWHWTYTCIKCAFDSTALWVF